MPHTETMTVSIQVVKVGKRKMTQALFKQLPEHKTPSSRYMSSNPARFQWVRANKKAILGYVHFTVQVPSSFSGVRATHDDWVLLVHQGNLYRARIDREDARDAGLHQVYIGY